MQSNPTQNTQPRSAKLQNTNPAPVMPINPPPVEAREASKARMTFERALERLGQSDSFSSERSSSYEQRSIEDRPERDTRGGSDQQSDREDDSKERPNGNEFVTASRTPPPLIVAAFNPFITAAAPMLSQEQIANLQRMASAIAEVAKTGVDAKMTVQFGGLNGVADGAILGRDARGGLTIHLVGASPHITPAHAQMLRSDLMQRLLKRKLDVSSVDFLESDSLTEQAVTHSGAKR
jgi:hypothetical protein